jgi:hypothetical protein
MRAASLLFVIVLTLSLICTAPLCVLLRHRRGGRWPPDTDTSVFLTIVYDYDDHDHLYNTLPSPYPAVLADVHWVQGCLMNLDVADATTTMAPPHAEARRGSSTHSAAGARARRSAPDPVSQRYVLRRLAPHVAATRRFDTPMADDIPLEPAQMPS